MKNPAGVEESGGDKGGDCNRKVKGTNINGGGAGDWELKVDMKGGRGCTALRSNSAARPMSNNEMSTYVQRTSKSREGDIPTCPFQHLLQLPAPYSGSGPLKGRQKMQFEYFAPCSWPTQVNTNNNIRPASQELTCTKMQDVHQLCITQGMPDMRYVTLPVAFASTSPTMCCARGLLLSSLRHCEKKREKVRVSRAEEPACRYQQTIYAYANAMQSIATQSL